MLRSIRLLQSLHIDARKFQIIYLGFFLMLGTFFLAWDTEAYNVLVVFGTALLVQSLFIALGRAHSSSWMSALITALGICLLFRSNAPWIMALAAALAIGSKFFFRIQKKHLFNPANFGIVAAMLLTGEAWISPGQWGSSIIFLFMIAALGSILLFRVGRLDTTLTFLGVFVLLEYCRTVLYLGWSIDVLLHKFTNGSFLLFAFFMITDPKTTPDHPVSRKVWAVAVALLAFALSNWLYVHTAPIWALFFITPLNALLDRYWKAKRFKWISEQELKTQIT